MKTTNLIQHGESVAGGWEISEDSGAIDSTTRKMTNMFLYRGGGGGGSRKNRVDEALDRRAEQREREDPVAYERWRRDVREQYADIIRDRETVDWWERGKPVEGPLKLTPTPETARDRKAREAMARKGYASSGRDPQTGELSFKRDEEVPWFLGILGGGYEMVGTIMHNIPYSRGSIGFAQRLENAVGSLIIGEVRGGDPALEAVYDKVRSVTRGKYDGSRILEIMGNVPALRDTAHALWVGHMRGLMVFQQNLSEDGAGTALLDRCIEEYENGFLGSDNDFADTLVTILSTMSQGSRFGAVISMKDINAKEAVQSSLEVRGIKIPREVKDPLGFLGIEDRFFEDLPYVKCSGVSDRVLEGFSDLVAQTTYARLVEKLIS